MWASTSGCTSKECEKWRRRPISSIMRSSTFYQVAIRFVAWTGDLLAGVEGRKISAMDQLDRASTSIPLNIAEGQR